MLQSRIAPREAQTSLVQLEHSILPSFVPPPPTDRLLKRIAGKQVGPPRRPQGLACSGCVGLVVSTGL